MGGVIGLALGEANILSFKQPFILIQVSKTFSQEVSLPPSLFPSLLFLSTCLTTNQPGDTRVKACEDKKES